MGEKGYGWGARKLQILIGVADMDSDGGYDIFLELGVIGGLEIGSTLPIMAS